MQGKGVSVYEQGVIFVVIRENSFFQFYESQLKHLTYYKLGHL